MIFSNVTTYCAEPPLWAALSVHLLVRDIAAGSSMPSTALSLYRNFMRVASKMPTGHRRDFVLRRIRSDFRANANCSPDQREKLLLYGSTMLDQASEQQRHLIKCKQEGLLDSELLPQER